MTDVIADILAVKTVVIAAWLAGLFLAERAFPAAAPPAEARGRAGIARHARNAGLFALNAALSPLIVIPVTAFAAAHALDWRPAWWSGWAGLALDLLLLDLFIYWWHRANHEIPFLWRFHEVHHLDRFLDTTTAVRFHFGEVIASAFLRGAFVFIMGIPLASVLIFEILVLLAALFQHSNLRLPRGLERALTAVIVTPAWHWMHHHAKRVDTDSNYGTALTLWDRLFGTACRHRRAPDMPIGVEGRLADRGFLGLLARPLDKP